MAKTKIKSDALGLYARIDGYICRPLDYAGRPVKTAFAVGMEINGNHPAGSQVSVTNPVTNLREYWSTTICYWWHPVEGRGKESAQLRQYDRNKLPQHYPTEEEWKRSDPVTSFTRNINN